VHKCNSHGGFAFGRRGGAACCVDVVAASIRRAVTKTATVGSAHFQRTLRMELTITMIKRHPKPRPCRLSSASALIAFHPLVASDNLVNRSSGLDKPGLQS
jgi:hypothetical protein